jgi:hypothetical protein
MRQITYDAGIDKQEIGIGAREDPHHKLPRIDDLLRIDIKNVHGQAPFL